MRLPIALFLFLIDKVSLVVLFAKTENEFGEIELDLRNEANSKWKPLESHFRKYSNSVFAPSSVDNIIYFLNDRTLYSVSSRRVEKVWEFDTTYEICAIDVDYITKYIYIAKQSRRDNRGRIDACSLENLTFCTTIFNNNVDGLRSLILDSDTGNMFWQSGMTNNVETSSMSGENRKTLEFENLSMSKVRSVFYDSSSQRIFFIESNGNSQTVLSCLFAACQKVINLEDILHFVVYEHFLIWSASWDERLFYCEISNCQQTLTKTSLHGFEMFVVVNPNVKENLAINEKCSEFSLLSGDSIKCACETGRSLISHNKCRSYIRKLLYISSLNGILTMSLDTTQFVITSIKNTGNITESIVFDTFTKTVYWLENDGEQKYLKSINEELLKLPKTLTKIRFDSKTNHIFWLDDQSRIGVTSLSSKMSKTLIFPLTNCQSFAIDENQRSIMIAMDKEIHQYSMDGKNMGIVYESEKNAISDLNINNNILIWIENYSNQVKIMDLASLEVSNIDIILPNNISHPTSIDFLENEIFISFLIGNTIVKYSLNTRVLQTVIVPSFSAVSIKVVNIDAVSNDEVHDSCQHISLLIHNEEEEITCECADGFYMDKSKCVEIGDITFVLDSENVLTFTPLEEFAINILVANCVDYFKIVKSFDIDFYRKHIVIGGETHLNTGIIGKIDIPSASTPGVVRDIERMTILREDALLIGIFEISVDYVTGNIYWTNEISNQIEVMRSDGSFGKVLLWEKAKPRHIVVNTGIDRIFYYDASTKSCIKSLSMSGEPSNMFHEEVSSLISLAFYSSAELLFWIKNPSSWILTSTSFRGTSQEMMYVGDEWKPLSMFVFNNWIYVTEESGRFAVYDGSDFKELWTYPKNVKLMRVYEKNRKLVWKEQQNWCLKNEAKCDQICLSEACTCQSHFSMKSGKCAPNRDLIFLSKPDGFYVTSIESEESFGVTLKLSITVESKIQDFAVHSLDRIVYWVEENEMITIKSTNIDDPTKTIYKTSAKSTSICNKFHSLTVDSMGHQLYVTCYRDNIGYVIAYKITSGYVKLKFIAVIVSGGAYESITGFPIQPKDIAVFPNKNMFFYVDGNSHIIQCGLDGKRCLIWRKINGDTKLIAYDDILYNVNNSGIWSTNLRTTETQLRYKLDKIFDIAPITIDKLLIATTNQVLEIPRRTTLAKFYGATHLHRTETYDISTDACRDSKCSHICTHNQFNTFLSPICLCPLGMEISSVNEYQCVPTIECLPWQFTCANGRQCIHSAKKCDGVNDCLDHSDESFDICYLSNPEHWPCDDLSERVNRTLLCDGIAHCADSSDELHCRCERPYEFFDCAAGRHSTSTRCISRRRLCDRVDDCGNNEDEKTTICKFFRRTSTAAFEYTIYCFTVVFTLLIIIIFYAIYTVIKDKCKTQYKRTESMMPTTTTIYSRNETPLVVSTVLDPHGTSMKRSSRADKIRRRQSNRSEYDEFPRTSTPFQNDSGRLPPIALTPIQRDY